MPKSLGVKTERSSEKDLYKPKETLLKSTRTPESHPGSITRKIEFVKAGEAIAKKRGIVIRKEDSMKIDEEEATLVGIAVKSMLKDAKSGKTKIYDLEDVLEEEDKRRGL